MEYVTVDMVTNMILGFGPRCSGAVYKIDIRSAYRMVPVHPEDRWLLGMQWGGQLLVDTVLPFDLRSAPKLFTAVADAVEWVAKYHGLELVFHYMDDFLLILPVAAGATQLNGLLAVFKELGLPLAAEKLEGPSHRVTFLGIEVDTATLELHLSQKKILELKSLVGEWLGRKSCWKELQSLVGKLQHACKVVKPG